MTDLNDNLDATTDTSTDDVELADRVAQLFTLLRIADRHAHRGHGGPGEPGDPGGRRGRDRRGEFRGEIRSGQGRVLGILALQSPLSQKSLAYMLGVRPQSLSELVSKLERRGLVTRSRDAADRRSFLIDLTEEGRSAVAEIDALPTDDPFDVLTDEERETYSTLTAKVVTALEEKFPEAGERVRHLGRGGRGFGPGFGPGFGTGPHGHGPHDDGFRDAGGTGFDGPGHGGAGYHAEFHDRPSGEARAEFREHRHGRGRGFRRDSGHDFGPGRGTGLRHGSGRGMNPGFA